MRRLPPRFIGRIVGFGADANGLNPGDTGYDSTTDPNSTDYVPPVTPSDTGIAPGQGDVPINGSSVPEGSTSQPSTASGTLNALSSGWNTVSNWFTGNQSSTTSAAPTNSVSTSNNSSYGTPTLTMPGSSSSTTSLASMSVLGVPLWLVAVAIGGIVAVNVFGKKGMGRRGGRRRSKRPGARRAHARRRGRRRNPAALVRGAPYFLEVARGSDGLWWYTLNIRGRTTTGSGFPTKSSAVTAAKADARGRRRKNPVSKRAHARRRGRRRNPVRRSKRTGRFYRAKPRPSPHRRKRRSVRRSSRRRATTRKRRTSRRKVSSRRRRSTTPESKMGSFLTTGDASLSVFYRDGAWAYVVETEGGKRFGKTGFASKADAQGAGYDALWGPA
jgi:hypothetical protein